MGEAMNPIFGAALLAALTMPGATADTTIAVRRGAALQVDLQHESVVVDTWGRDAVRVNTGSRSGTVEVRGSAASVRVSADHRAGANRGGTVNVTVPAWMDVRVTTLHGRIAVRDTEGEVNLNTVHGTIEVRGGRDLVSATSVGGSVSVSGVRGRVKAETVNNGLRITDVRGDVDAETVNGGIVLADVQADNVTAESVNGSIQFAGPIRRGGYYRMISHNGSVVLKLAEQPDAKVSVSTYNGELVSDFPIQVNALKSKSFSFEFGSGSARIELESFNGTIRLTRSR